MTTAPAVSRLRTTSRRLAAAGALARRAAPGALAVFVAVSLAAAALPVAAAWFTKAVLDGMAAGAPARTLLGHGAALAAVGLLTALAPQATRYLRAETDRAVQLLAQDRLFGAVQEFTGLARFEDPRFLDRLRLAQQAGRMTPNQSVDGLLGIVSAALTITGFLGSLLVVSPVMTALVLGAGLPVLLAQLSLARRRARMFWDIGPAERRELFYADLLTTVDAAKEVRLFGTGPFLRARMRAERRSANAAQRAVDRRDLAVQSGLGLLTAAVAGGGLLWAVGAARTGALSVGDITVFIAALAGVQGALTALAGEIARTHQALLMFDHYLAVTTAGPDLPVPARAAAPEPLRRGIELRDVWFRYSDGHPWVLRGVSLTIPYGRSLALVGLNGAGKSTLVKLLCRMYDPTRGAILWDGTDLRDLDPAALRRRIGAVFQDYMTYDLTAAENIALGDLDALDDPARIRAAARRAGIDRRIRELPQGYDTLLTRLFFPSPGPEGPPEAPGEGRTAAPEDVPYASGGTRDTAGDALAAAPGGAPAAGREDTPAGGTQDPYEDVAVLPGGPPPDPAAGVELSGGQWQRLALARALLRERCDLMVLDEPSAGLDAAAEHEIHTALRRHRRGRTSLLISHRLGAVRDADLIVVLDGGRIVERGDHRALTATGGAYARLFALQAAGYRDAPQLPAPALPLPPGDAA
ncbi:ABC transporter ATP-binding protein [Streptomyces sp. NPDC101132]|uniref:ABC transporter ATP-binding protein n=1 Tax=Streptomyces sp. NPDC101132 TaxID=3366110 RepID=UPI003814BB89